MNIACAVIIFVLYWYNCFCCKYDSFVLTLGLLMLILRFFCFNNYLFVGCLCHIFTVVCFLKVLFFLWILVFFMNTFYVVYYCFLVVFIVISIYISLFKFLFINLFCFVIIVVVLVKKITNKPYVGIVGYFFLFYIICRNSILCSWTALTTALKFRYLSTIPLTTLNIQLPSWDWFI